MAAMLEHLTARKTLHQAYERVRDNGGCRGADGMSLGDFTANLEWELDRLEDRLLRRAYHPFPLLRLGIPKTTSGLRHLSIPTVRDRVVQTAVDLVTRDVFEREFEDCSHAYRCGRSVRTAVHRIRELRDQGYRWVVDADIDGFFDNISHERLLARVQPADFTSTAERGVFLRKEAMKRYFVEYEKELNSPMSVGEERLTWRQLFRRQAERLARSLLEDEPYEAFRLPC